MMKYCCDTLKFEVEQETEEKRTVFYYPHYRGFGFRMMGNVVKPIFHCPYCGAKLPEHLDPADVVLTELGPDYFEDDENPSRKIKPWPTEFQTDEWWKTRGL
jgi:hypothetical protein